MGKKRMKKGLKKSRVPVFAGTAAGHPGNSSTEGGFELWPGFLCIALQPFIYIIFKG